MLESTIGFQKAFDKLEDMDDKFLAEFRDDLPTENDWINVGNLTKFLKRLYEVTCKLSGSLYSTSNLYFPKIIRILKDLQTFESSTDSCLVEMGKQMRTKFDMYWGDINKLNVMFFIANVLDPRYKMKYLRVKYNLYYGEKEANELVDRVTKAINVLMEEYKAMYAAKGMEGVTPTSSYHGDEIDTNMEGDIGGYFLEEEDAQKLATKGELDKYLEELAEKYTHDFDILGWWKINAVRFPLLANVAGDVLAIQSSTVAFESAFSTGGRILDRFRSSLTPTTAEILICWQDWLRSSNKPIQIEEIIEELESFELDIIKEPEIVENVLPRTTVDC